MMEIIIIPPLESPHRGGANGGLIIKICFLSVTYYKIDKN